MKHVDHEGQEVLPPYQKRSYLVLCAHELSTITTCVMRAWVILDRVQDTLDKCDLAHALDWARMMEDAGKLNVEAVCIRAAITQAQKAGYYRGTPEA